MRLMRGRVRRWQAISTCLLLPVMAAAQSKPAVTEVVTDHLRIRYDPRVEVASDGSIWLAVEIAPRPRMHVYAPGKHDYRVITMTLSEPRGIRPRPIEYPASEIYHFEPLDERIPVYQKPFTLKMEARTGATAARPPLKVAGHLDYQACDDQVCFAPVSVPLAWTLTR
jgi:DsbC/DsbD-like thiol-disulfide interchange protein